MYSGLGPYNMDAPAAGELLGLQSLANVIRSIHVLTLRACQCDCLLVPYADCLAAIGIHTVQRVHVLSCGFGSRFAVSENGIKHNTHSRPVRARGNHPTRLPYVHGSGAIGLKTVQSKTSGYFGSPVSTQG